MVDLLHIPYGCSVGNIAFFVGISFLEISIVCFDNRFGLLSGPKGLCGLMTAKLI